MTRRIVFIGNCQMEVLRTLYDRFAGGITGDETHFLADWTQLDDSGARVLAAADLLVDQVQSFSRELALPASVATTPVVPVPLVSASFLWPYAGSAHPANADTPFLKGGPYPGELGDGYLNRLIRDGVPAAHALEQYRGHDLGGRAALDRRCELIIHQQRLRDQACDFAVAAEIEAHFRSETLFLSPHHPGLRITRTLAAQCFSRIGVPLPCIDMLLRDLRRSPFPQDELPVHPAAARHFGLASIGPETRFAWRGEGRFTWEQWVLRYLQYAWSPALFEGWTIAAAQPATARDLLLPVLDAAPRSPLAHAAMAKALHAGGQLAAALGHAEAAVELAPEEPEYARIAAFVASGLGRRAEAVEFARAAAAFDAGHLGGLQLLARLQEDAGDFAAAEATRRLTVQLRPRGAGLWTDLGTTLSRLERAEEALWCYRHASGIAPDEPGAHFGASLVLAQLGSTDEAIAEVEVAIRQRPGTAAYFSHLGHLMLRAGQREAGIAAFRSALEFDPDNGGIHNLLAEMMAQDGCAEAALHHAWRAAECAPAVAQHQVRAADLLARQSRVADAIALYRRAIELLPGDRSLPARLGGLYARLDRLEEAAETLFQAIDPEPDGQLPDGQAANGAVLADLAAVLMRMGRFAKAAALLDRPGGQLPQEARLRPMPGEIADIMAGRRLAPVASRFLATRVEEIIPAHEFIAPACIRYTNFQEMNPSFGTHHVNNLYVEKRRWVPAVSLCALPADARLAVPNGEEFIAAVGNLVVAEQIRRDWPAEAVAEAFAACTREETLAEPAVLIGRYGIRTWGHWLGELLPKVVAVEQRWPRRFRYIVPDRFKNDPVHRTAMESLAYYGIDKDRLILATAKTIYACENLHVVTSVWSEERMLHPEVAVLMREFGPRDREPAAGWLKAALLRRSTRTRNIHNLAEVENILAADGFTMVDIERLNFRQQVDLFRNAAAIAGVLGSGLSGLIYAPRGVQVLTMAPGEWGDLFFYSMMQERDAVFADIRGRSAAIDRDGTSGFEVPPLALCAGLGAIAVDNVTDDAGPA